MIQYIDIRNVIESANDGMSKSIKGNIARPIQNSIMLTFNDKGLENKVDGLSIAEFLDSKFMFVI